MRRWQLVLFVGWVSFVAWGLFTGRLRTDPGSPPQDAGAGLDVAPPPVAVAPQRTPFPPETPDQTDAATGRLGQPTPLAEGQATTQPDAGEAAAAQPAATPPVTATSAVVDAGVDVLGVAEDGSALEVFPLPAVHRGPDAGEDEDRTVIWQDDSGLIAVQRSKKTLLALALPRPPPRGTPPRQAESDLLGRARRALAQGRFEEARFAATHARAAVPDSPEPWLVLAELARKQNDVAEARWCLDQAQRRGRPVPAELAARLGREAKSVGTLPRSETAHATISAPFDLHEPTRIALHEAVEQAWQHVRRELGFEPPGKVAVVLYRDEEFTEREGGMAWAAGDYDGRVRLSASAVGNTAGTVTLIHEMAHHFVSTRLGAVPAWFNEGVAQAVAGGGGTVHCGGGHDLPLGDLTNGFRQFEARRERRVAYAVALHAVQRLGERTPLSTAFPRMAGPPFAQAFEAGFGESLGAFVKRFDDERP